ncbi:MAG: FHA domain-containing protein [Oscillochloridaceae bacterium umkhey_bin13]
MQICNNCQAHQLDGTIFCPECGASMLPEQCDGRVRQAHSTCSAKPKPVTQAKPSLRLSTDGLTLRLILPECNEAIEISDGEYLVGRPTNSADHTPLVDLTPCHALELGVSRRHALIKRQGERFVVQDLMSANGTFVNGLRLPPNQAIPIAPGDELRFSLVVVQCQ